MTITAKIIADSEWEAGNRITTMQVRYPRMIHSEFMTHRVFSRNASSSRAVPIERMIQEVIDDPAMPVAWGSNKPGMQAGDECTNPVTLRIPDQNGEYARADFVREDAWLEARYNAVEIARAFAAAGYHKQVTNRLLEPFAHISVVVTATEWDNFFDLRCHPDADPTMRALAEAMRDARDASEPNGTPRHLPYIHADEREHLQADDVRENWRILCMISAARCARVSYLNHDGRNPDIEKDIALADRLLESRHLSPFEHQARATGDDGTALWGNFTGWDQFRKMVE